MSWNKIDDAKEGGGIFIKLKDGESIEGVFRGEPYCFYQIYGDQSRTEYEEYVKGSSFKFRINMIVKENGAYSPKILQGGITLGKLVRKMTNECGMDFVFKVEREGSTKDDTEYYIFPKGPVPPASLSSLNKIQLQALTKTKQGKPNGEANSVLGESDDDVSF